MKRIYFIMLAVIAMIVLLVVLNNTNTKNAQAIFVAPTGNDHNEGSKSKPFRTLKKAASEAKPGTTVYIRKGTYHESLVIRHRGTKSKPIKFKAYKNEKVVLSGKGVDHLSGDTALVTIKNKNYVTIMGLSIQDLTTNLADETVMGIYVTGSSSHITLENNHVQRIKTFADDGNAHGIAIYGTGAMNDINILNNTVEKLKLGASESIVLNGNIDGFRVENNLVRYTDNIGIDLIGYEGVSHDKDADYVRNGVVQENKVYEVSSFGNPAYGEEYSAGGIYVDGGKKITIKKNTIFNSDIGIEATSEHANKYAENIIIIDNIVYNNYYTGISIGGYDENRGGTVHSTISKNIVYRNDIKGLDGGQILLQYDIKNNIIEKNVLSAGPSRLFIVNDFTTNQKNILKRNVFHKEKGKAGLWVWKEKEYTSFSDFKAASKSDAKSSYINPKYKNEDKYDFTMEKDSLAKKIVK
ncbi:right-handed parallel beta-helix repeat-containing protein [Heyndrickxia oleronia]|uniref:right-handed parallel beta-helix repeat-containing protein n=1 Tax=Heyndrickxia oleronia TaxID=38875 RepID=UPI003F85BFB8